MVLRDLYYGAHQTHLIRIHDRPLELLLYELKSFSSDQKQDRGSESNYTVSGLERDLSSGQVPGFPNTTKMYEKWMSSMRRRLEQILRGRELREKKKF